MARKKSGGDKGKVSTPQPTTRFLEMHRAEIWRRAEIFRCLGYDPGYAIIRIKQNIEWDFELLRAPNFINEVKQIVQEVYPSS